MTDPKENRRHNRVNTARQIEIQLGDWYSATVELADISDSGLRIAMPGGVSQGQRFRVVLRSGDDELTLTAEVQWSTSDGDHSQVGLSWVHDGVSNRERLAFLGKLTAQ